MGTSAIAEETDLPGKWFHRLEGGRIQCDLCLRNCRLREGQKGILFCAGAARGANRACHLGQVEWILH